MSVKPAAPVRISLALVLGLATAISLSGCFSNPLEQLADGPEQVETNGGQPDDADGEAGTDDETDGGATGNDDGGDDEGDVGFGMPGTTIPDDFPREVPVFPGDVIAAYSTKTENGTAWTVGFAASDPKAATARIKADFAAAGFTESYASSMTGMFSAMYQSNTYGVVVGILWTEGDEDDTMVTYTVAPVE